VQPLITEFMTQLSAAHTVAQAYDCTRALGLAAGFEFSGYVRRQYTQLSTPQTTHYAHWPEQWLAHYEAHQYADTDPALHQSVYTGRAVVWDEALFEHQPAMRAAMLGFGLQHGCTVAVRHHPLVMGVLSFAGSVAPAPAFFGHLGQIAHLLEHTVTLLSAGPMVYDPSTASKTTFPSAQTFAASAKPLPTPAPAVLCPLTLREIQVLRLTADGKSALEAAQLLDISERTVGFHLGRVMNLLGAANKTACVTKALMSGWLY
jgi:DNA-binding CsgD family transcriptional regulator